MKKILFIIIVFILLLTIILILRPSNDNNEKKTENLPDKETQNSPKYKNIKSKNTLVEFGDYKCPYCTKFHNNVLSKSKDYIDKNKLEIRFVNMAFLGKGSIKGSRAAHAVNIYAPEQYWKFHDDLLNSQPKKNDELWLNENLIDKKIDNLPIIQEKAKKIKENYKEKNSSSWQLAKEDKILADKYSVSTAPTIYINGNLIETPYTVKDFKKKASYHIKK